MNDLSTMREKAQDPNTSLATLQSIAQDYPALRPDLALNPATYPDLLNWLRDLGDPEVNAALAKRAEAEQIHEDTQAAQDEVLDAEEETPYSESESDIDEDFVEADTNEYIDEIEVESEEESDDEEEESDEEEDYDTDAVTAEAGIPPLVLAAAKSLEETIPAKNTSPGISDKFFTKQDAEPPTGKRSKKVSEKLGSALVMHHTGLLLMWLLLGLIALGIIIAVILTNVGAKPSSNARIPVDSPTPITTGQTTGKAPVTGTAQPISNLPEGYSGPVKTIEVPGPKPGQTLLKVVPDKSAPEGDSPSKSASPTNSASPSESATPSESPSKSETPTPTTNPLAAPDNAKPLGSFTTADNNVRCLLSESQVQCFANQLQAATNCETRQNDTGYTLVLSGNNTLNADCVAPQSTQTEATLKASESAKYGKFACKNSGHGDTVMCWDTSDGDGFVIGKSTIRRFGVGSKLPDFPQ